MLATALLATPTKKSALRWLMHLGGPSLVLLGLVDNSVVPMPGSTDVFTVLLAAHHREPWFYYAIMATIGGLIGGWLTYRMARAGGKDALEKKLSPKTVERVCAVFERHGFVAVAIPAVLPPPFPMVPVLLAAGALQYPTKKFLTALAIGRGARYTILAYLGFHYGRHIVRFFSLYYWRIVAVLVALSVIAALYGYLKYKHLEKSRGSAEADAKLRTA